jgi:undecaprenyl-diphosphatase
MTRQGRDAVRLAPGCVFFALLCFVAAAGRADGGDRPLVTRSYLGSVGQGLCDFGTSPLRAGWEDLAWALPAGGALALTFQHDVSIYGSMAKGDARKEWLDHSMPAVSALGDGLIEFAGAALVSRYGSPKAAETSAVAMQALLTAAIWDQALKFAAWSNRPYIDDTSHRFFAYDQDTTGFPSGHSASAFAAAEVYGAVYGRLYTYPLAALVGCSRIYVMDHWPSDVLGGALLGVIIGVQARRAAAAQGPPRIQFSLGQRRDAPMVVASARF